MLSNIIYKKLKFSLLLITVFPLLLTLNSCGIYKKVDARKVSPNPDERVKKNLDEGRGFRLLGNKNKSGDFSFATSNELWQATLETLDFIPLSIADYGGGIVITDWYNDSKTSNESLKISVRFLSNEIRSDSIMVKIFKKNCSSNKECSVFKIESSLNNEIKVAILKKASLFKKKSIKPYGGKVGELSPQ
jgi:hypothetical protein